MAFSPRKLMRGAAGVSSAIISKSLRFRRSASAYLSRTPTVAGNQTTWTYSTWVKRGIIDSTAYVTHNLFGVTNGQNDAGWWVIAFMPYTTGIGNNVIRIQSWNYVYLQSTPIYVDPSAWYHVVVAVDTTQATGSNRIKLYVNGVEVTAYTSTATITQNSTPPINSTVQHQIGRDIGQGHYSDYYLADTYLIDGQQLTPSSFGKTDTTTGVWSPILYTGGYGTNGFHLKFTDNSNTTATTLGRDYSGSNSNNWTPNNFSVSAGVNNDSLVDVPTSYGTDTGVGGEVRGNYATLNPLAFNSSPGGTGQSTFSNGNLQAVNDAVSWTNCFSTISMNSGKFYFEFVVLSGSSDAMVGIYNVNTAVGAMSDYVGHNSSGYIYYSSGQKATGGSFTSYGASWTTGDVIGTALDLDAGTLVFYKNGVSQGTAFTGLSGNFVFAVTTYYLNSVKSVNFGQRPFAYTAPSGFKALCTTNLPAPTIAQGNQYMDATLYTGTGATQTVTNAGSFRPDLFWLKSRSVGRSHRLLDTNRGTSYSLYSDLTQTEDTISAINAVNSNGFTLNTTDNQNISAETYVAWQWKANGTSVINTSGSVNSQVSANPTSGFSIVTYTGPGGTSGTIGHGLGVAPSMIIVKTRTGISANWTVYHTSIGNTGGIYLNTSAALETNSTFWNNTSPSSTVFTVGNNAGTNYSVTIQYVAYCFAPISGYSAFGSYVGNGATKGPFVYTGFRPKFVLIKNRTSSTSWQIYDTSRSPYNLTNLILLPSGSNSEITATVYSTAINIFSNGFQPYDSGTGSNTISDTYIYMAFADNPFKYALAR